MNYRSAISFLAGGEPSLVKNVHQSSFNLNISAENRGPSHLHSVSSNKIPSTETLNIPTRVTDRRTNGFVGISQRSRRQYIDLAKPKSGAPDFITIKTSKLFMLHKTRVAIRFRAKKPSPQTTRNFALVCLWCGRTDGRSVGRSVGVRSRDCQIFSDG